MTSPTARPGPVGTPAAGPYRIDPERTTIAFTTRHLFGLGKVVGTFRLRTGDLVVGDPVTGTTLHAVLDAASFDTGTPRRDDKVRSGAMLDAAAHPDIVFRAGSVVRHDDGWLAQGTVDAHGVGAPVELTVDGLDVAGDTLTLRGHARIDRYAHGVTASRGLAARWLDIRIDATATATTA